MEVSLKNTGVYIKTLELGFEGIDGTIVLSARDFVETTNVEALKKLGEFFINYANKLDDLEFDHPMGQS